MRLRNRVASIAVVGSAVASLGFAGSALAAAPDFSDCPTTAPGVTSCLDFQSTGGTLRIGGTSIDLGNSLRISGGLARVTSSVSNLVPAAGTTGLASAPVELPGGLARSGSSSWLNRMTVQLKYAGTNPIVLNRNSLTLTVPVKLAVKNPILGTCKLGSDAQPITLNLIVGTTEPPAPNTPISGALGIRTSTPRYIAFAGNKHVDNSFGVPASKGCNVRLFNPLLDWRLGLASAAGDNSIQIVNDLALSTGLSI